MEPLGPDIVDAAQGLWSRIALFFEMMILPMRLYQLAAIAALILLSWLVGRIASGLWGAWLHDRVDWPKWRLRLGVLIGRRMGLIIFAHGSGSSRFSTRNRQVAAVLQQAGFATLLLDLLTADEERADAITARFRFDIPRLGRRVIAAADWTYGEPLVRQLLIGYFGASTGAAAALVAAAARPAVSAAVVSRGGRPDLAQAGGPDGANADAALDAIAALITGGKEAAAGAEPRRAGTA